LIGFVRRLFNARPLGPRLRGYKTIDASVASAIVKAHKANPALGRQRLQSLLSSEGLKINGVELKRFLRDNKIDVEPPAKPARVNAQARRKPTQP
jgi:hypothetical protein